MAIDGIYATGTISVNSGATAVTGIGTAWVTVGITAGDTFEAGGLIGLVESVTDNTHLTLTRAWPGASNLSGAGYQIIENSWLRSTISTAQRQIGRIVNILNGTGYIYPLEAGGTPDNSLGEDGQYAQDFENGKWWKKAAGAWGSPHYQNEAGDADYLVKTAHAGLTAERVVTDNNVAGGIVADWSVAGQVKFKDYFSGADKFKYSTSANTAAEGGITANARTVLASPYFQVNGANIGIGTSPVTPAYDMVFHKEGSILQVGNDCYGANSRFLFRRANGTVAAPTALVSSNNIGGLLWHGYNGSAITGRCAAVFCIAAENWSTIANGAYLTIETTPIGATASVERVRILDNGNVGIQQTTAICALDVNGPIRRKAYTVATLPSASLGDGMVADVTDSNSTALGSVVAGGGANNVAVRSVGGSWLISGR